ncbi:thiamine-phosphate pyrophosphorylase [Flavobacterium fluvii]|uniref:Thiamine-phosphate pyrophosphorylase n=1 Tax=Flavobacterium fluvii TaxID=468056 RepID=A0A1M5E096_9FLAO|nr:thiamine phosphate synthase [Flavobacterium fluvii]SHF72667.1 thiamine-phosphate pyrophosphorylase [Flavobacterium fluvii]
MIVITNPIPIANEISTVHSLFENGLELLHIRKPEFSAAEMKAFLLEIKLEFRQQLVLHTHHQLAPAFGINRLHLSENIRKEICPETLYLYNEQGVRLSTSTHDIEAFNDLRLFFEYGFLSPVFPSISKMDYQSDTDLFEAIKSRTNFSTQLVALGGISSVNISKTIDAGFDNVALLGSIWNSNNPIENFKLCQKNFHLY